MRLIDNAPHMLNLPCQFYLPVVDDRERTEDEKGPTKSFTAAQVHQQGNGLEWFEKYNIVTSPKTFLHFWSVCLK